MTTCSVSVSQNIIAHHQFVNLKILKNFQGCFTVQLSRFFSVALIGTDSFDRITCLNMFVNIFFKDFTYFVISYQIIFQSHQSQLRYLRLKKPLTVDKWFSGEDGIRTHAPVKTNGFQDRPVMTTSVPLRILLCRALADDLLIITPLFQFVNNFFKFFLIFSIFS